MTGTRGPVPVPLETQGRNLTQDVLDLLDTKETLQSNEDFPAIPQKDIKAALDRLASRSMVEYKTNDKEQVNLTSESEGIVANGSHEFKVWEAVKEAGKIAIKELPNIVGKDSASVGQGNAFKNKWIKKDGTDLVLVATEEPEDGMQKLLKDIQDSHTVSDAKQLNDLKKKKLVTVTKVITYTVTKGPKYAKEMPVEHTDLTEDLLKSGAWETANFKPYNFAALGAVQNAGALHPLMKVRQEFRNIFFSQGFIEMPTQHFVDSGFWNFDALFVPQQHPARDMQDTFFVSDPPMADKPRADPASERQMDQMEASSQRLFATEESEKAKKPRDFEKYWNDVKKVHEDGAFGSIGYRYKFKDEETLRLVLRTHTTAVSTWALHRLAENPRPARYFSIDRVFRNETVDATHLAEFHQIEGVIADFGLTLGGLQRFLGDFFANMGLSDLRFKPAYNPYTEDQPSMEIFGYHEGLKKWIEIGNSGMFRPEMLEPMGLPKDMRVYGFGLSLERPTMMKYGVSNIRELLGHKVDLSWIKEQPAVRFDKE